MKLDKFWVVMKPTPSSVLADLCFETNLAGLFRQFKGGLEPAEVHGIYTTKEEAYKVAEWFEAIVYTTVEP